MSEFQQGMILKNTCSGKHRIYIQDIPDVGYGKNCIVYCLDTDRYIVADDTVYKPIEEDCPVVNVLHTKALMNESYNAYIRNASEGAEFIAEQALKHFQQLMGSDLILTDGSTFEVQGVCINKVLSTDWKQHIVFSGFRNGSGRTKRQSSTLSELRPNSVLLDALCKAVDESDK